MQKRELIVSGVADWAADMALACPVAARLGLEVAELVVVHEILPAYLQEPGCFERYLTREVATICRRELCPAAAVPPSMVGGVRKVLFFYFSLLFHSLATSTASLRSLSFLS